MYNMQKLCAAFLCSFTMCFRVVYKINLPAVQTYILKIL